MKATEQFFLMLRIKFLLVNCAVVSPWRLLTIIGKRKPESEAFQIVADSIGVDFHQMVFYDDSIDNIIGAKKVGLNTVHVKSIFDIKESFKDLFGS